MFEAVTLGAGTAKIAPLVDALAYYSRVRLVTSPGEFAMLASDFGYDNFMRLLERDTVAVALEASTYGVHSSGGAVPLHAPVIFHLSGEANGRKIHGPEDAALVMMKNAAGERLSRKQREGLLKSATLLPSMSIVADLVRSDFDQEKYLEDAAQEIISQLVPDAGINRVKATSLRVGSEHLIGFDLPYARLNEIYHRRVSPSHSTLNTAYVLSHILTARKEIVAATEGNSDVWLDNAAAAVVRLNIKSALQSRLSDERQQSLFQDVLFERRSFGDAVQSGVRSAREFVDLLENNETLKFKNWLNKSPAQANLIEEYYRAVFAESGWLGSTTGRAGKVSLFTAGGLALDAVVSTLPLGTLGMKGAGAAASLATNIGDEFVLTALVKGWRPNQWVEGPARDFLSAK